MAHADRGHARWSASASERNFACPGALALIESFGIEDVESTPAAWGTACHQIAEECLRRGMDAAEFIGGLQETKAHKFTVDEEMAECTQVFLDYVRGRIDEYEHEREFSRHPDDPAGWNVPKATLLIEQNFDLSPIDPPLEAGGTGDVVMLFPAWGLIEIVDLKTGKGWVDAKGNKQLRTYALGAALANPGPWKRVRSTIVQPRIAGNYPVRYEEIDVADLLDWTQDLKESMVECAAAIVEAPDQLDRADWHETYLRAGDHCHATFCPAVGRGCPAIEAKALAEAQTFFTPVNEIAPPPEPKSLPVEKIVGILDAADMIEAWLNGVRQYARELVEGGTSVGPYILVDKQARRKWKVEDEKVLVEALTKAAPELDPADCYVSKMKSPAQVDAMLKTKDRKALVEHLWTKESSGTNLVRSDKTTRAPALPPARKFFQPETERT